LFALLSLTRALDRFKISFLVEDQFPDCLWFQAARQSLFWNVDYKGRFIRGAGKHLNSACRIQKEFLQMIDLEFVAGRFKVIV
jgi:hypothetical protein